jgi:hypothetical protein
LKYSNANMACSRFIFSPAKLLFTAILYTKLSAGS